MQGKRCLSRYGCSNVFHTLPILRDILLDFLAQNTILHEIFPNSTQGRNMYTTAGTSRRKRTLAQLEQEVDQLHARMTELENYVTGKLEKAQMELAAEMNRIELRFAELEQRNKRLELRLEIAERRLQFETHRLHRPDIGFDKIGIA